MRLGQLARKLALRPSEIVDFLSTQKISIDADPNTRLNDDHVQILLAKFSPESTVEEFSQLKTDVVEEIPVEEPTVSTELEIHLVESKANEEDQPVVQEDKGEVIKAPKIELQGLKVVGKIELPAAKKKAEEEPLVSGAEAKSEPIEVKKPVSGAREYAARRERPDQRTRKNPIALAREKEEAEVLKKRELEAESAKEQRTKNYQKRVKVSSPTKRARLIDEPSEELLISQKQEQPATWFGRVAKWFKT